MAERNIRRDAFMMCWITFRATPDPVGVRRTVAKTMSITLSR
jgi:hypothetical protein